jgi:hypothetical protein
MAWVIGLVWLLAMSGLFGWLLWWNRVEGRDDEPVRPAPATALDLAAARALDGDEECERLLWQTLIDALTDYRDLRSILEYIREHPPIDRASSAKTSPNIMARADT